MRRVALFTSCLMLSGCAGMGVFFDDTHGLDARVNRPIGNSENMRLVEGQKVTTQVLTTEPGNVWPGPVPPEPTLEDLQKMPARSLPSMEGITPPPIANVPNLVIPAIPHHIQPRPGLYDDGALNGPIGGTAPPAPGAAPNPRGITVPNGDGTSTVILPDGTIKTIPTPK